MGLFGKTPPPDPREKARVISRSLRKEERVLDRQIQSIKREEDKVKRSLRDAAKKGDRSTSAILAKEIIHSRKAVSRIYASKAQLKSVDMNIKNQLAMVRVSGAFEKSTEVMKMMQSLIKVGEVRNSMMELSKEMTKMGIMEEMMEDTFESLEGDEEDEAAQEEIDKVLHEITAGAIGKLPDAEPHELPSTSVEAPEEEVEEDEMVQRLAALRS